MWYLKTFYSLCKKIMMDVWILLLNIVMYVRQATLQV